MIPSLQLLDHSYESPAHNIACDEALLEDLEAGLAAPTLRFWESPAPFVVLGYANKVASEANIEACRARGVPILRRSSGGGTVVQGPGCLNYNLTLPITDETANITDTNCYIMRRHRDALSQIVGGEVKIQGHTDLTVAPHDAPEDARLKFSGNAQRRKSRALVFHGCFLLPDFDLAQIDELLAHPSREPDYRAGRAHRHFVTAFPATREQIKAALGEAWGATQKIPPPTLARLGPLIRERYSNEEWNAKF